MQMTAEMSIGGQPKDSWMHYIYPAESYDLGADHICIELLLDGLSLPADTEG